MVTPWPFAKPSVPTAPHIVYRAFGNAASRPLVLIHGWAQSSRCWGEQVVDALAERYRVIALDLRGHGCSGVPAAGYDDSANWAADVDAVLSAEGISAGAALLGWSYGVVICDYLAAHGTVSGRRRGVRGGDHEHRTR